MNNKYMNNKIYGNVRQPQLQQRCFRYRQDGGSGDASEQSWRQQLSRRQGAPRRVVTHSYEKCYDSVRQKFDCIVCQARFSRIRHNADEAFELAERERLRNGSASAAPMPLYQRLPDRDRHAFVGDRYNLLQQQQQQRKQQRKQQQEWK